MLCALTHIHKELSPVSFSSSLKLWSSSDSNNEEGYNIDTDDPESSDSDMLGSLSSLLYNLWHKRQLHTNTYFSLTIWMLCVIPHIYKDEKYHSYSYHSKQVNNVIKTLW